MAKVFCLGEVVFDIFFNQNIPFDGRPGGAMLNSSISLGRSGLPVEFVSAVSTDKVGQIVKDFLTLNGVAINHCCHLRDTSTRLALAFFDSEKNAEYSFYRVPSPEKINIPFPDPTEGDIILFGSFYGFKKEIRPGLIKFLKKANQNGAIVVYDPNFRKNHMKLLPGILPMIEENVALSNIVKFSSDDALNIFGSLNFNQFLEKVGEKQNKWFIYTQGPKQVISSFFGTEKKYNVSRVETKSTVGAGDSFNAGLIFALYSKNIFLNQLPFLPETTVDEIIQSGICFGSHVCCSFENYISQSFAQNLIQKK